MTLLHKYPRTHHIEGSRFQPGDEDLASVPFPAIKGRPIIVEEKLDGANAGICFTSDGKLLLQSRGHFLVGGARERHFNLFKAWAKRHRNALWDVLGGRYVLYGEWLFAKHTIFYDRLPHYFLEFDILDTMDGSFLSTDRRQVMLRGQPMVSVPVLWSGPARSLKELRTLLGISQFKSTEWRAHLHAVCRSRRLRLETVQAQTDDSDFMEGLYIKVEEQGRVVERYKYIRASFLTAVLDSDSHWLDRPIIPNQLREGSDIFAGTI